MDRGGIETEQTMMNPYRTAVVSALGALLASGACYAEDFDRGQALYENHCKTCHDEHAHTRAARRAATIEDLHKWVATWSFHASLGWSEEEIGDVVDFMDRRYYHFRERP